MGDWIARIVLAERHRACAGDPEKSFLIEATEIFKQSNPDREVLVDVHMLPYPEQVDPNFWRFQVIVYLFTP